MELKKLLFSLSFLILILASLFGPFMIKKVWAQPSATRVYVDPATNIVDLPNTFNITVKIEDAQHIAGWQFELYYDSDILYTQKSWVIDGGFITSFVFSVNTEEAGKVAVAANQLFGESSGSGSLAEIMFQVISTGRTSLDLRDTQINDASLVTGQPDAEEDGVFYTTFPRAEFIFSTEDHPVLSPGIQPSFNPVVNETITFNATFIDFGGGRYGGSYDPDTMTPPSDPDGQIASYMWDFGDGNTTTISSPVITHAYDSVGSYMVNLTVTDNDAKQDSFDRSPNVVIHDLAIIDIEVTPTIIRPGETATIDATVLNKGTEPEAGFNITTYYDSNFIWYNQTANLTAYSSPLIWNEVSHTWGITLNAGDNMTITWTWNTTGVGEGTYSIKANVTRVLATNPKKTAPGETRLSDNEYVYGNVLLTLGAPVASFIFTPQQPRVDETVTFNATASNDTPPGWIEQYTWDFGDNTPILTVDNTTLTVQHNFTKAGTYNTKLTVTDNEGYNGTKIQSVTVAIHELNITSLSLSLTTATAGTIISVNVNVKNEGGFQETYNVTAHYDTTLIGTKTNIQLDAGKSKVTTLQWNTTGLAKGTYTIKAEVSIVPNEVNTTNNIKTTTANIQTHDIAVTNISLSKTTAKIGETITINVTLANEGSFTEIFNITTYYNGNIIANHTNISLDSSANTTETFTWNTSAASVGTYTVKAEAILATDTDPSDNTKTQTVVLQRASSTITLEVSTATVTTGGTATINGTITPTRGGVNVTIYYKLSQEQSWSTLATVATSQNSQYAYDWNPTQAGTYNIYARWEGDTNTEAAESSVETITVEATQDFTLYIIAGVGIAALAAIILIYFLKIKK